MKKEKTKVATLGIREITSAEEFTQWANRVNEAHGQEYMHELQDVFARSNDKQLRWMFASDQGPRKLWLFAIMKCMGEDQALSFVRSYAEHIVDEGAEREEKRLQDELGKQIFEAESQKIVLQRKEAGYQQEISQLTKELDAARAEIGWLKKDIETMSEERHLLRTKAGLLVEIRLVLRQLMELGD